MLLVNGHVVSAAQLSMLLWADDWEVDILESFLECCFLNREMVLGISFLEKIWIRILSSYEPSITEHAFFVLIKKTLREIIPVHDFMDKLKSSLQVLIEFVINSPFEILSAFTSGLS